MRKLLLVVASTTAMLLTTPTLAEARCHTHRCWHKVHVHHLERMVEKRIAAITPYRCGPVRSAVPCSIINHESSMCSYWYALNGPCPGGRPVADSRTPCDRRACGIYQLLGAEKHAPWPVIITSHLAGVHPWVSAKYETLKRMLTHHRIARSLPMSAWGY